MSRPDRSSLSRRTFLERSALASAGLALPPWLLPGCSGSSSEPTPDGQSVPPLPYDPSKPWWLQGNFAPVLDELDVTDLPVTGAIPPELSGLYVRNGSNPQKSDSPHWFFGDGMVHGLRFEAGKAKWYRNRYVKTPLYTSGTSFGGSGPPTPKANQSNVSMVHHAGRLLTSGEVGFPYELDPETLETKGVYDFAGKITTSFTAHPKIDPKTGQLHFFGYWFLDPYLTYSVADATGAVITSEVIQVAKATMIHSFAITEKDAVFWELPVVFDLDAAMAGALNPYAWDPSYGARIGVMPLGGAADSIRWVEIDACYVFHEVNAYRDGDVVVVDVCRHPSMFDGQELYQGDPQNVRRWKIDTGKADLSFSEEVVADLQYELPTHDRRFTGRKHRHGWFVTTRDDPHTLDFGGTGHIDLVTGVSKVWDPGAARHADEAFFVPGGSGEGEGWLLTFVYDHVQDSSALVILDATNVDKGPVAEIALPRRVPHGFHAVWIPA